FGALTAELRRAEANHHDMDRLLPRLIAARGFDDADDIASVLHHRVTRATARPAGSGRTRTAPRLIAGLVPAARGPMTADLRHALDDGHQLVEHRATAGLDTAITDQEPWTTRLGAVPEGEKEAQAWRREARVVAAYRDHYQITGSHPLGPEPDTTAQKIGHARADTALQRAQALTRPRQDGPGPQPAGRDQVGPRLLALSDVRDRAYRGGEAGFFSPLGRTRSVRLWTLLNALPPQVKRAIERSRSCSASC